MKEDMMRSAIGGIDPRLVEAADAAPRKKRGATVKKIVAIALAVMVTTFGLLMLNAQVRAAIFGAFTYNDDQGYVRVHFNDAEPDGSASIDDVSIGYIPEGFILHEISDDDFGEYQGQVRMFQLIPPEYSDMTDEELLNTMFPNIVIWCTTADVDWGYDSDNFEATYESTINGMPAFVNDNNDALDVELAGVTFGNADMSVRVAGTDFTLDEVIAVAESISW